MVDGKRGNDGDGGDGGVGDSFDFRLDRSGKPKA